METEQLVKKSYKTPKILKVPVINKSGTQTRLSKLEIDVITLLSEGMKSKDIADVIFLSPMSIDNVKVRLIRKLDVKNSCEAVAFAIRSGIIQ